MVVGWPAHCLEHVFEPGGIAQRDDPAIAFGIERIARHARSLGGTLLSEFAELGLDVTTPEKPMELRSPNMQ